jgi:putative ABC transport system permease protein
MPARRVGEHAAILRLITTQSALVIASGIACGAAASWLSARQVRSLLFDLDPADAETMFLAVGVVLVATALAAVLPARRASRVNPAITLR